MRESTACKYLPGNYLRNVLSEILRCRQALSSESGMILRVWNGFGAPVVCSIEESKTFALSGSFPDRWSVGIFSQPENRRSTPLRPARQFQTGSYLFPRARIAKNR